MNSHIAHQKRIRLFIVSVFISLSITTLGARFSNGEVKKMDLSQDSFVINLPSPAQKGKMSLEEALKKRESVRSFSSDPLTKEDLSQLLWAVQGITRNWGARTAPSAGALFPLEIYVVLKEGFFRYSPKGHNLVRIMQQDLRNTLSKAALGQNCIGEAPAVFVIAAVYERTSRKYGNRAERYVKMEAGHAGQNLLLQAVSLGLGAVPVGAFQDEQVQQALHLPVNHEPLYLIPVGWKR
ncbi:MAG: SagB/ThcOx family dehydrogenase [Proteobacteria bacterium]|jgi:SagB-type dehydrogenase family enzyme|nr:SagB/ThcOx family dehydrogenase [Pseudomonadota bacterium]